MEEEYTDQDLGWHIKINRDRKGVSYVYKDLRTGDSIEGGTIKEAFTPPSDTIREHLEDKRRNTEMRNAGVMGNQIARRILEMVGELHKKGYESLYIDPVMAPHGGNWRYKIGAMRDGLWPCGNNERVSRESGPICGSIRGGYEQEIPWGKSTDSLSELVKGFLSIYPNILEMAKKPNSPYVEWYSEMLKATRPEGILIFSCDWGPIYEYAFTWGEPNDFKMPMPPGYVGDKDLTMR
jgi:hypothetical protein